MSWLVFAFLVSFSILATGGLSYEPIRMISQWEPPLLRSIALAHLSWLWTVALAATMQMKDIVDANALAQGWEFLAVVAPVAPCRVGAFVAAGAVVATVVVVVVVASALFTLPSLTTRHATIA